jgi:hypothetical protein
MQRIDRALCDFYGVGIDDDDRQVPTCGPDYGREDIDTAAETPIELAGDLLAKALANIIPASGPIRLELLGQRVLALYF